MKSKYLLFVVSFLTSMAPLTAKNYVENRVLVKYSGEALRRAAPLGVELLKNRSIEEIAAKLSVHQVLSSGWMSLRYSSAAEVKEVAKVLRTSVNVEWAQPDYLLWIGGSRPRTEARSLTTDLFQRLSLFIFNSSGFEITEEIANNPEPMNPPAMPSPPIRDPKQSENWGLGMIDAAGAWKITGGDRSIVVADIDTGVDYNHEDLINNMWRNPDPNAEDKVGYDFANKDAYPWDDQGHGTHTSGSIGATGGNGIGISGVARSVQIMAIKFITDKGWGSTADAVASIDYAVENGARILSNSWGGAADEEGEEGSEENGEGAEANLALYESVARAGEADVLFVAAAGNDGTNNDERAMYPASFDLPNVLTVAGTNDRDRKSFYSNYGPETVDVGAPGGGIYSTVPGNKYLVNSGTSMACPHVAGLAALILSANPSFSALEVKEMIMETVDPIATLEGKIVTGGRINAARALQKAMGLGI